MPVFHIVEHDNVDEKNYSEKTSVKFYGIPFSPTISLSLGCVKITNIQKCIARR